jgi:hypothetical protein
MKGQAVQEKSSSWTAWPLKMNNLRCVTSQKSEDLKYEYNAVEVWNLKNDS